MPSAGRAIVFSAIFNASAFLFPAWCWIGIVLHVVPLIQYCINIKSLGFKYGFLWGLIFYGCYLHGLCVLLLEHAEVAYCASIVLFIFFVCYCAMYAGIWFWTAQIIYAGCMRIIHYHIFSCLIGWVLATIGYWYIIDRLLFWIFGIWAGNRLQNELLPCMAHTSLVKIISYIPYASFWYVILFLTSFIFAYYLNKWLLIVLASSLLIAVNFFDNRIEISNADSKELIEKIGCIIPQKNTSDPWQQGEHIAQLLIELQQKYPKIQIILFPESSFCFPLNLYPDIIAQWSVYDTSDKHILIGSHRKETENLYNSIFHIHQGLIINYYDKHTLLFFTEKVPHLWQSFFLAHNLFLKNKAPFECGDKTKTTFSLPDAVCAPYICSELFFATHVEYYLRNQIITAFVNDAWFSCSYVRNLMYLYARLQAIVYYQDIIYVSYHRTIFINKYGGQRSLSCIC